MCSGNLPEVDLVVIYLGGCDWFTLDGSPETHDGFVSGFEAFLKAIRLQREQVPILVLTADERSGSCLEGLEEQKRYSQLTGDLLARAGREQAGVHVLQVDCGSEISVGDTNDWGLMGHWSVASHRKWARGVISLVAATTGWKPNADLRQNQIEDSEESGFEADSNANDVGADLWRNHIGDNEATDSPFVSESAGPYGFGADSKARDIGADLWKTHIGDSEAHGLNTNSNTNHAGAESEANDVGTDSSVLPQWVVQRGGKSGWVKIQSKCKAFLTQSIERPNSARASSEATSRF